MHITYYAYRIRVVTNLVPTYTFVSGLVESLWLSFKVGRVNAGYYGLMRVGAG